MRARGPEDLQRVHVWLAKSDVDRLHRYFGDNLGFSRAVRQIITSYLNNLEARAQEKAGQAPGLSLEPSEVLGDFGAESPD